MRNTLFWFGISFLTLAATGNMASAMITLKQVQVTNRNQVDLLFDGKVGKNQIQTEFFNDIIQLSLNDVSVYPAKISSVNGGDLVKIFAYQYAPKLVRARFSVKGKAEDYKGRVKVVPNGKIVTLQFLDGENAAPAAKASAREKVDRVTTQAAAPARVEVAVNEARDPEEKDLLNRVMSGKAKAEEESKGAPVEAAAPPVQKSENKKTEKAEKAEKIAGGKPLPGLGAMVWKMGAVLALFGIVALVLRKFLVGGVNMSGLAGRQGNPEAQIRRETGWFGAVSRMMSRTGLSRKEKMIQVMSTHYLGPKKSIAVVKVMGRLLVLGVSSDSINLITELADDALDDLTNDLSQDLSVMNEMLFNNNNKKAAPKPEKTQAIGGFNDLLRNEAQRAPAPSPAPAQAPAHAQAQAPMGGAFMNGYGPSLNGVTAAAHRNIPASNQNTVRSQIRSRLEGLKQL